MRNFDLKGLFLMTPIKSFFEYYEAIINLWSGMIKSNKGLYERFDHSPAVMIPYYLYFYTFQQMFE